MHPLRTTALLLTLLIAHTAGGQDLALASADADLPWVGVWRVEQADLLCSEQVEIAANGATTLTSGRARSDAISLVAPGSQPSGDYYRWEVTAERRNSEPDCIGKFAPLEGFRANYLRVLDSGARLLLCEEEEASACFKMLERVDSSPFLDLPMRPPAKFDRIVTVPQQSGRRRAEATRKHKQCADCADRARSSPASRPRAAPWEASDG